MSHTKPVLNKNGHDFLKMLFEQVRLIPNIIGVQISMVTELTYIDQSLTCMEYKLKVSGIFGLSRVGQIASDGRKVMKQHSCPDFTLLFGLLAHSGTLEFHQSHKSLILSQILTLIQAAKVLAIQIIFRVFYNSDIRFLLIWITYPTVL